MFKGSAKTYPMEAKDYNKVSDMDLGLERLVSISQQDILPFMHAVQGGSANAYPMEDKEMTKSGTWIWDFEESWYPFPSKAFLLLYILYKGSAKTPMRF